MEDGNRVRRDLKSNPEVLDLQSFIDYISGAAFWKD